MTISVSLMPARPGGRIAASTGATQAATIMATAGAFLGGTVIAAAAAGWSWRIRVRPIVAGAAAPWARAGLSDKVGAGRTASLSGCPGPVTSQPGAAASLASHH